MIILPIKSIIKKICSLYVCAFSLSPLSALLHSCLCSNRSLQQRKALPCLAIDLEKLGVKPKIGSQWTINECLEDSGGIVLCR